MEGYSSALSSESSLYGKFLVRACVRACASVHWGRRKRVSKAPFCRVESLEVIGSVEVCMESIEICVASIKLRHTCLYESLCLCLRGDEVCLRARERCN